MQEKDISSLDASDHVVVQVEKEATTTKAEEHDVDEDFLHRLMSDAGRWAYGTVIVEMWVLNEQQTSLYRPKGGWWVDPVWHDCPDKATCQLCRLSDPGAPGYQEPPPVAPGFGLVGLLWSELQSKNNTRLSIKEERRPVIWKDLNALRLDPDQPFDSRIKQVGDVGLGYGGGVSFSKMNEKGVIIFVARAGVDLEKLRSLTNETYLRSASDLIASAFALRGPRRAAQLERKEELDAALRRARIKIQAMIRMGISLQHLAEAPPPQNQVSSFSPFELKDKVYGTSKTYMGKLWRRLVAMMKKTKGAGVAPSPPFTIRNSLYTFLGVFSTLLILTRMNSFIDDEYNMELGPFGALMTLQYTLTAAPASQPMNAVLGQAISLAIAIGIGSISGMDLWIRQSLATALAIMTMAKLGLTHPPAGAAALIFASGSNSWGNYAMMLVGNCIAILTATLINNFNITRQYPMTWEIGWAIKEVKRSVHRRLGLNDDEGNKCT